MSEIACTVADACRIVADRTGDQQAAYMLRDAGRELDRLTAELEKHQPEEREGVCECRDWQWGVYLCDGELCPSFHRDGCPDPCPEMTEGATRKPCGKRGPEPHWYFTADPAWSAEEWGNGPRRCNKCAWELDPHIGIARRNADTARVQRVRAALDELAQTDTLGPLEHCGIMRAVNAIRAALEEAKPGE